MYKLLLHLTNFEHNYALYNKFNGDILLNTTIGQWLNIREVRHAIYMIDIHPPNTRFLGTMFNMTGMQYSN
jgi:hypothetical protein